MSETLKQQVEDLLATVKHSHARVGDGEVGERLLTNLLNWLEGIITSPFGFEILLLKDVYQVAKNQFRGSDNLRKEAARMLGSLMLNSDSEPEDIEFLTDDLQSVF
eukprot:TRINITY_DN20261_c0_g1_i1.p1 TRINITY_DN20261_c0_g1~~TRINITY_DN20261_c0_g1_i1.p1  ORF type:complete len:116 (+),score=23.69 TRINITY_DN20261_c0_g1_i1:33-350(+)